MRKTLLIAALLLVVAGCGSGAITEEQYPVIVYITEEEPVQEDVAEEDVAEIRVFCVPERMLPVAEPDTIAEDIPAEETPEPPLFITEDGVAWRVPPTFEHDHISFCSQCGFIDSQKSIINPLTGEWEGWFGGHGGWGDSFGFVYDMERNLFGMPRLSYEYGGMSVGMHQPYKYMELFGYTGFVVVQSVDSAKRVYWDSWVYWHDGESLGQAWRLTDDAFLGVFAVMYNGILVTDFIFDEGFIWPQHRWSESDIYAIAMSKNGLWGTIDRYGDVSIPFIFDHMSHFDERAIAVYDGKHGLIDVYGNVLVPFLFDEIYHFGSGSWETPWLAAVNNGKHGLIDESGNIVIPFLFDHLFNIDGDTAFAKYNGLYGIIDIHQTIENINAIPENPLIARAERYFAAVDAMFANDNGDLWGFELHVPIMFVDTDTQEVITNRPDPDGILTRHGEVYVGVLPYYLDFSRLTYEFFGGELWIIMPWQMSWFWMHELGFRRAISHKAIHWHQITGTFGQLRGSCFDHLHAADIRISMRLEINALLRAFRTTGEEARLAFIHDALSIRYQRRQNFGTGVDENILEMAEGLAQYTEWSLTERSRGQIIDSMEGWAQSMLSNGNERMFGYLSGALYAFLLNETGETWKLDLSIAYSDLGQLLKEAVGITELRDTSEIDLTQYRYYDITREERHREERRR